MLNSWRDERMISFIPPQAPEASAREWSKCILEIYYNSVNWVLVLPCYYPAVFHEI